MSVEENMFVAVEALRLRMIDHDEFVDVCQDWAADKDEALADVLEEKGKITPTQKAQLESLLESKLRVGDARDALAGAANLKVRDTIRIVRDADIQRTIAGLPPASGIRMKAPEAPVSTTGRYTLTREYSEGGLSRIWLARDANLHRDVILKELHPDLCESDETRKRFMNEAQITGQLEHPNIVPVYELGPRGDKELPFYTMRFVRGETLQDAIRRYHEGRTGPDAGLEHRRLLGVFGMVCNAIAYAHSRGVLHRDLKPQNVVLGGFGEVILLDWGLAKLAGMDEDTAEGVRIPDQTDPNMTLEGAVLGTPAYIAPELAEGRSEAVSERTDVYGLGGILFEILTGRPPHTGDGTAAVIRKVLLEDSPRAEDVEPSTPPALDAICAKAMAKDPDARYESAAALADDLQRYLADHTVSAYPEPAFARLKRWMRRHRFATITTLFLTLSLGAALVNLWWQKTRAVDQEMEKLSRASRQESGRLNALIDVLRADVEYLGAQDEIQRILLSKVAQQAGKGEPAKAALAEVFSDFLRHRTNYFQARLIGKDGVELVRVDRERDRFAGGEPERVLLMQDKSSSGYFKEAIRLPGGQIYLSKVELNREDGVIEHPEVPVIRAAVPVFSGERTPVSGNADGVVVINIDFKPLFEMLQGKEREALTLPTQRSRAAHVISVTNNDGYYLWNPSNPEKAFGFEREPKVRADPAYRIQAVYPELSSFFEPGSADDAASVVHGEGAGRRAVHVYRLGLDAGGATRFLGVAVEAPYAEIAARARATYRVPVYTTIALVVALVAILAWAILVSRRKDRQLEAARLQGGFVADRTTGV